jgi:DNA-binding transcriptional ArsR family regulator
MGNRAVVVDTGTTGGGLVLVFGVPIAVTELYRTPETGRHALDALVGRTRAAVLRELTVSRTTSELAARLGISSAGASQHATVLRDTGLIASHRNGNTVQHSVTALGTALLTGELVHSVA